jgi:hypothetical protein
VSQKWCRLPEPESTHDDAHPIATGIVIIGRVKWLLKIANQMQHELERDRPFARMVARVGKLDVECHAGLLLSLPPAERAGCGAQPSQPEKCVSR